MPFWLLSALGLVKRAISAAASFITRNPWQAAVIALACLSAWLWRGKSAAEASVGKEHAARLAERKVWAEADRINHATITALIGTLNDQTASIERWYRASQRQQADATKALAEAKAKGAKLRDKADALEAAAPGIKSDCKTPREVLDMKGDI